MARKPDVEAIARTLNESAVPLRASQIAGNLGVGRSLINAVLYAHMDTIFSRHARDFTWTVRKPSGRTKRSAASSEPNALRVEPKFAPEDEPMRNTNHYIAYHSTKVMGGPYSPSSTFDFYSSKSESFLRGALGGVAWVIVGDRVGRATRYQLAGRYQVSELEREDDSWIITGPGMPFRVDVTNLPWFVELRQEQSNFSLGFNRICSSRIIAELNLIFERRTRRMDGVDALGAMTTLSARFEEYEAKIAKVTGLTEARVRRQLAKAHGKTLVRNVFRDSWPSQDDRHAPHRVDADALGAITAATACSEEREAEIAELTGLTEARVRRQLAKMHGKTLVRNVFYDSWPNDDEEGARPGADERSKTRGRTMPVDQGASNDDESEHSLQGRPDHQRMQKNLVDLGGLTRHHVRTNHPIGAGFKPDVLWYRLDPSEHANAAPIAAFEIEFGSAQAIAKSLSSLKHAFDLGTHRLFLILPSRRVDGARLRLRGAFHEIAEALTVLPIEDAIRLGLVELAKRLGA